MTKHRRTELFRQAQGAMRSSFNLSDNKLDLCCPQCAARIIGILSTYVAGIENEGFNWEGSAELDEAIAVVNSVFLTPADAQNAEEAYILCLGMLSAIEWDMRANGDTICGVPYRVITTMAGINSALAVAEAAMKTKKSPEAEYAAKLMVDEFFKGKAQ